MAVLRSNSDRDDSRAILDASRLPDTRVTRRRFLKVATGIVGVGLLAACGGDSEPAGTEAPAGGSSTTPASTSGGQTAATTAGGAGEPKRGGTLKMTINTEARTLDPHGSRNIAGNQIKTLIYSQLLKYYYDREVVPDLAEEYEASDDGTSYVFTLRQGVKFHDGAALTAEDVKASYERILNPEVGSRVFVHLRGIEEVIARDDVTVEFRLKEPQSSFIRAVALPDNCIAQKKKIDAQVDFETDVVGTGPFKLASRSIDVATTLERNPDYFLSDLPYLDGVEFRPLEEDSARMNTLFSGDADIVTYINWATMNEIEQNESYILQSNKEDGFVMITFRVDRPPFDNQALRQAISYAIDRAAIIATAASGRGQACFGGIIPSWMQPYYSEELANKYAYDIEKAKELLAEAGGEDIEIEFRTAPPDDELFGRPAVVVTDYLKQAGFNIKVRLQTIAEETEAKETGNYQMMIDGSLFDLPDPDFLSTYYATGGRIPAANRFSDQEIDDWLLEGRQESDENARVPIYENVQAKALDLEPICWLFYREQGEAMQSDVQGYQYLGNAGNTNALLETWLDR